MVWADGTVVGAVAVVFYVPIIFVEAIVAIVPVVAVMAEVGAGTKSKPPSSRSDRSTSVRLIP